MRKRGHGASSALADQLDGFFRTFSAADGDKLADGVCRGFITGADLARELKWTRDKVSRRSDDLHRAGIIEKRRHGRCKRLTPQLAGAGAAQGWLATLRPEPLTSPPPSLKKEERYNLATLFADQGRRSLLTAMHATPGATQAELVRACGLSQSVASRGLTRLVEGGLAARLLDGGRARYTVKATAVEGFLAWLVDARRKLTAGRERAMSLVLPAPGARAASDAGVPSPHPNRQL